MGFALNIHKIIKPGDWEKELSLSTFMETVSQREAKPESISASKATLQYIPF